MRLRIPTLLGALLLGLNLSAQAPLGYSLPRTALTLTVTVERTSFFAGPYARYAQKYLGIDAREDDGVSYRILSMELTPSVEADPAARYAVPAKGGEQLLTLSAQGLVATGLGTDAASVHWHFPAPDEKDFASRGVSSNLTSVATTLYEQDEDSFSRTLIHERRVVSKPLDQRAEEAADKLLDLRETRLDLLSGNTDGDFSGEALEAAIRELTRLEEEYRSLFTGYSVRERQTLSFDVLPAAGNKRSVQVAFRLSDEEGLLPAADLSGRPFTLECEPEAQVPADEVPDARFKGDYLRYRVPAVCRIRVTDGERTYLTARLPIAQKGQVCLQAVPSK